MRSYLARGLDLRSALTLDPRRDRRHPPRVGRALPVSIALLIAVLVGPATARAQALGDIVFQQSTSRQARVIREVTGSPWTHVGVVLEHDGERMVLEAVEPVRWTRLEDWVARGRARRVAIRRLRTPPTAEQLEALERLGESWVGRGYDLRFEWSDARMYCSELVFKLFRDAMGIRLVEPQRWRDLRLTPRARRLARRRLGRLPPRDGRIVSPAALLASPMLVPRGSRD